MRTAKAAGGQLLASLDATACWCRSNVNVHVNVYDTSADDIVNISSSSPIMDATRKSLAGGVKKSSMTFRLGSPDRCALDTSKSSWFSPVAHREASGLGTCDQATGGG